MRSPSPPRGAPGFPRKSKGEPTDLLLDSGNHLLGLDQVKRRHAVQQGFQHERSIRKRGETERVLEPLTQRDRFPVPRPLPQTFRNALVPGCGERPTERTASVRPIVWTLTAQAESPWRQGFGPPHAPPRCPPNTQKCCRRKVLGVDPKRRARGGTEQASPRNLSRGTN